MAKKQDLLIEVGKMQEFYRSFVQERDWEDFHSPKNLSMALSVEASELLEIFQWLTEKQSFSIKKDSSKLQDVKDEMADIFAYLIRLADVLEIDLAQAFWEKFKKNEQKYPIEKAKELSSRMKSIGIENEPRSPVFLETFPKADK